MLYYSKYNLEQTLQEIFKKKHELKATIREKNNNHKDLQKRQLYFQQIKQLRQEIRQLRNHQYFLMQKENPNRYNKRKIINTFKAYVLATIDKNNKINNKELKKSIKIQLLQYITNLLKIKNFVDIKDLYKKEKETHDIATKFYFLNNRGL